MEDILSGFKPIPGYEGYWINEENVILDYENLYCELPARHSEAYDWVYLTAVKVSVSLHRLKALAFCKKAKGHNLVNHKDGDKRNNASSNLEWTTHSGNLLHAYKFGLRDDNVPMQVIDSSTNKYYEFYSMQECARFFNVNGEKVHRYMRSSRTTLFMKRYVLLFLSENIADVKAKIVTEHMNGCPKFIQSTCVNTGSVTVYSSIGCASRTCGIKMHILAASVANGKSTVLNGLVWSYADPDEVTDVISDWVKPTPPKRLPSKIKVTDSELNHTEIWESANAFADHMNVGRSGVKRSIYKNGGWQKYKIEYIK